MTYLISFKHQLFIFCFVVLINCPLIVSSQNSQSLTLDQALQLGMEASKQLMISGSKLQFAKAKHDQTFDLQFPSTKLSSSYYRMSEVPDFEINNSVIFPAYQNSFQNRVSLYEIVFAGLRIKTSKEAAEKNYAASEFDFEKDKQEVKLNIITAFYNLYKIQQSALVIDANLKVIEQRVKDIDNLEKNGLATNSDLLRVKLQQSNTELLKIEANNILQSANFNFNQLIGLQPNTIIVIDTANMFEERNAGNSDAYMNSALDKRPELQSIALRTKAAEDNLKNAKNNLWPVVNAGANFYFASPNQRYVPPTDVFHQTWDVGVNLNWDITTLFTNKHVVAENKAIVSLSNATTGQLSDAVKSDVYQNYLAYTESLEKLIVLKKAVEQAEENLRITNSMYRNNLAIISDLTDAQSFQLQAAINMVIAKADNQISYFKLLKSSGDF